MEGWGPASRDQVTWGHPAWLLSMDSASAPRCGDRTGWQCQAYPGGPQPRAGTYTLPSPGHRGCSEVTACPQSFSQNPGDTPGGMARPLTPCDRLHLPRDSPAAWVGAGCSQGRAQTVPLLAGAGLGGLGAGECCVPLPGWAGLGRGAGHPAELPCAAQGLCHEAGPVPHVSPCPGMLGGRMALTPLRSLSPRTRGCRKTSQTR